MSDNPFKKAIASRSQPEELEIEPEPNRKVTAPTVPNKRGRPATGKRSDDEWIGRTFYVKRETDLDVEQVLLQLKREGRDVDKSELVESLLAAWVKWHKGESLEGQLAEISPMRKSGKAAR